MLTLIIYSTMHFLDFAGNSYDPFEKRCMSDTDVFGLEWNTTHDGEIITIGCPDGSTGQKLVVYVLFSNKHTTSH